MTDLTATIWRNLHERVEGFPDQAPPGRFWRWLTEVFNEWPDGRRPGRPASEGDRRPQHPVSD